MGAKKIRFDGWVLHPDSGDLERAGTRIRLQEQPLQLLMELIGSRGDVVTREQLVSKLWPKGVVDFDTGLNTAIRRLRVALGDTADPPRYIETLPRRGYRFIAALDADPEASAASAPAAPSLPIPVQAEFRSVADTAGTVNSAPPTPEPRRAVLFRRALLVLVAVVSLVTLLVVWYRLPGSDTVQPQAKVVVSKSTTRTAAAGSAAAVFAPPAHSVAVLPFVNLSEDKNDEYLSDGLSEEIIGMLTKIPELHVPARTSSFYFKGKNEDISTIAQKLMVAYVVEGGVRKSGKHLRISAQLVRVDTGYHLWSETYDRQLDDVLKVEDEIARAVVSALNVSLLTGMTLRPDPTSSTEAYTLYLEGFVLTRPGSRVSLDHAIEKFKRALQLDPTFALAWAALSRALTAQLQNHFLPFEQVHDEALRAANRALKLDPALASAHVAIGKQRLYFEGDWAGADAEFKRALQLDPAEADTLRWAGITAECHGRFEEALDLSERAVSRDPLYGPNFVRIADLYAALGRFDDAEAAARKAVEVAPQFSDNHLSVAYVLLAKGKPDEALAEVRLAQDAEWRLAMEAIVYHALGRAAEADAALAQFREKYGRAAPYRLAQIHARRGERSQALAELERAASGGRVAAAFCTSEEAGTGVIKADLSFIALADDPRFKALLRKIKLPE